RAAAPALLELGELEDRVDGLLARSIDEGAGVDDEALGVLGALGERKAGLGEHPEHQLGIHLVLRTAKGREMDLHDGHVSIASSQPTISMRSPRASRGTLPAGRM